MSGASRGEAGLMNGPETSYPVTESNLREPVSVDLPVYMLLLLAID